MKIDKTSEKQKFAGIKAEQTKISVSQTCTVPNSEKSCDIIWNGALNKFRKKKKKPVAEAANPASGSVKLFEITTELTGVDEKDIPDNQFIVPAGWEQVAGPSW
jgi:hypothetical protein